jgi:hypothetical protein
LIGSAKRCRSRGSAGILFSLVHFLFKLPSLLLVDEAERSETFLQFKGVEKGSVLVIAPRIEDFLVPNDPAVSWLSQVAKAVNMIIFLYLCPPIDHLLSRPFLWGKPVAS